MKLECDRSARTVNVAPKFHQVQHGEVTSA
jgi:hypothetical protein